VTPRRHDGRFFALLTLANEGDESAIADLWSEYGHDYRTAGDPRDQLPTTGMTETNPKYRGALTWLS
jgi:hypothetical protein